MTIPTEVAQQFLEEARQLDMYYIRLAQQNGIILCCALAMGTLTANPMWAVSIPVFFAVTLIHVGQARRRRRAILLRYMTSMLPSLHPNDSDVV